MIKNKNIEMVIFAKPSHVSSVQQYNGKVPELFTKAVVDFARKKLSECLNTIKSGVDKTFTLLVLEYSKSNFVQDAGMIISDKPIAIDSSRLAPPTLAYGQQMVTMENGGWNVMEKKLNNPASLSPWTIVDYGLNLRSIILWVAFSPDGTRIAARSSSNVFRDNETIQIWDTSTGTRIGPPLLLDGVRLESVAFSPEGMLVASLPDGKVHAWDAKSALTVQAEGMYPWVNDFDLSSDASMTGTGDFILVSILSWDGKRGASGSKGGVIRVWDTTRPWEPPRLSPPHMRGISLLMSPSGGSIITSSGPSMRLWNAASAEELPALESQGRSVRFAFFSSSGHRIVSLSDNHTIRMWDSLSGAQLFDSRNHHGVKVVAFSPDKTHMVCGMHNGTIRIIDAASGTLILEPSGQHAGPILSVAYSPDGSCIVSGSMDQSVRVWKADNHSEYLSLKGHRSWVCSTAFSPDGKQIVSASEDGTIRQWDVKSGVSTGTKFSVPVDGVNYPNIHVSFSSDGILIICRVANEMICSYDIETGTCRFSTKLVGCSITHDPQHPIVITGDGWIIDVVNEVCLSKLPPTIPKASLVATAACKTAIAFATWDKLFVMHFVPGMYTRVPMPLQMPTTHSSFIHDPDALEQSAGSRQVSDTQSGDGPGPMACRRAVAPHNHDPRAA